MFKINNKNTRTTSLTSHFAFSKFFCSVQQIIWKTFKDLKKPDPAKPNMFVTIKLNTGEVTTGIWWRIAANKKKNKKIKIKIKIKKK